jgi:DNA invertase Pin-like site-specific DNA recombinase
VKYGYARVSTADKDKALQVDALKAAGCDKIYVDHASGSLERRVELDRILEQIREGDTLAVWRLDRLGRSLKHLMTVVADLETRGVAFQSLTETIDTNTVAGKLLFHIFGALAEFERALIQERTVAGLAAARARGRMGGRPSVWNAKKAKAACKMYDDGETVADISAVLKVSRASIYRMLAGREAGYVRGVALADAENAKDAQRPLAASHAKAAKRTGL